MFISIIGFILLGLFLEVIAFLINDYYGRLEDKAKEERIKKENEIRDVVIEKVDYLKREIKDLKEWQKSKWWGRKPITIRQNEFVSAMYLLEDRFSYYYVPNSEEIMRSYYQKETISVLDSLYKDLVEIKWMIKYLS